MKIIVQARHIAYLLVGLAIIPAVSRAEVHIQNPVVAKVELFRAPILMRAVAVRLVSVVEHGARTIAHAELTFANGGRAECRYRVHLAVQSVEGAVRTQVVPLTEKCAI